MDGVGGSGDPGCGTAPRRAGGNTSSPWRAVPGPGHRGRRDLEGLPCCCAPMPMPLPPRPAWRAACWRARRTALADAGGATAGNASSACSTARPRGCGRTWARCRSCGRTHIALLVVRAPARRCDRGDRHRAGRGAGRGGLRADRRRPGHAARTVRGWLRRLRSRAEEMRCWAARQLGQIAGASALPEPGASPLHDALNAVAAAAPAATSCPPAPASIRRQPGHRWFHGRTE